MARCSTRVFSATPRLGPATSAHFARSATRRRLTFLRATILKDGRLLMSRPIAQAPLERKSWQPSTIA
jgi:hypothetical protein